MENNNKIQIFENAEFGKVRTVDIDGVIHFVGKDVAQALGYADTNKAIAMHVDDEDKLNDKTASSLGQRGGWLITESGLYSLVLSSKLPTAKKFKHWVTSEILPSIRKTGNYSVAVPKTYGKKSTSVGEVASLIKTLRSIMKDQKSDPAKIAEMAERICQQFGIDIPEDLVEKNPFENQLFLVGFMNY